jgi:hypothetical protein
MQIANKTVKFVVELGNSLASPEETCDKKPCWSWPLS